MIASLSSATMKQYARPLRIWWDFCQRHRISPFSPRVDQVLDFLSQELGNVSSYSSFNTTQSAISLISDKAIGNHPLIKRFGRGVSAVKPQHARYDLIWDPAPVIAKLAKIFPYESGSLEVISRKLVLLLALGSGQRAQTLAAIKIPYIIREKDRLIIRIPDRVKTSTPGRAQPLLTFPRFSEHPELCVVTILDHYLQRVHADLFSAHSTRHASSSLAAKKRISLDLIKQAAGWSGESRVFANFYNHTIISPETFCNSVLLP
ncbi:hypothetical protein ALC57_02024 [Trachymyrmex cornetzi]|uniref:Tyr recombinase domain-containing protein n=1 Tax=Trachymyrmex cornetzi TaxID=471704 RepID=A0A151JPW4_9HYME|nr:hypothetical protein ALC57_02024 [Trachymyrmex cornetzi]